MGKAKKMKVSKAGRNVPLNEQLTQDAVVDETRPRRTKAPFESRQSDKDDEFVEAKLSKNILAQARNQLQELQDGDKEKKKATFSGLDDADSDEEDKHDHDFNDFDGGNFASDLRISAGDEAAFSNFMTNNRAERRTIADIIMEKINEKKTEIETRYTDKTAAETEIAPEVVEMYKDVGKVMAKYRSGKVPKAFKMIPQFHNWEELALLTEPDKWSAAAVFVATRIFVSGLQEKMAQRFMNVLLLPRVRDDIDTYQRLNFHLYQALRKALFKPGAFFKGFLLPLCEAGDCTLREATIIGSVLAKNSIQILHSCAVMLKIAEMEYSGANSIFLRVFLDKKYALPYRVVDALVFHFLRFRSERRELPVLWHQAFLTFAQRYKGHISSEQRDALLELLRVRSHHKITPEIRRELQNAPCRDAQVEEPMMME